MRGVSCLCPNAAALRRGGDLASLFLRRRVGGNETKIGEEDGHGVEAAIPVGNLGFFTLAVA